MPLFPEAGLQSSSWLLPSFPLPSRKHWRRIFTGAMPAKNTLAGSWTRNCALSKNISSSYGVSHHGHVLGWCGDSSWGGTPALARHELRKAIFGGVAQCYKYQICRQKVLYRKVRVCCLRVVFVRALTPKEPPCNGLGGEEKRMRIAKALLRTEMDCLKGPTG